MRRGRAGRGRVSPSHPKAWKVESAVPRAAATVRAGRGAIEQLFNERAERSQAERLECLKKAARVAKLHVIARSLGLAMTALEEKDGFWHTSVDSCGYPALAGGNAREAL